jgi:hypothetical protein
MNPHPHPRSEYSRRRFEFTDLAASTIRDNYDEMKMIEAVARSSP